MCNFGACCIPSPPFTQPVAQHYRVIPLHHLSTIVQLSAAFLSIYLATTSNDLFLSTGLASTKTYVWPFLILI